jgi:hypothetical protein
LLLCMYVAAWLDGVINVIVIYKLGPLMDVNSCNEMKVPEPSQESHRLCGQNAKRPVLYMMLYVFKKGLEKREFVVA